MFRVVINPLFLQRDSYIFRIGTKGGETKQIVLDINPQPSSIGKNCTGTILVNTTFQTIALDVNLYVSSKLNSTPPAITSWSNSKTNDTSLSIVVNESENVSFNATADQTITLWKWLMNNIDQSDNFDNFSYHFATKGNYTVKVNAANDNGTSNSVIWNVEVKAPQAITFQPAITSFSPASPIDNLVRESRTFSISLNQTVNITWYINGKPAQTNTSAAQAKYTNKSAVLGTWNVTVIAQNANGTAVQTWQWIVVRMRSPLFISAKPMIVKVNNVTDVTFRVTSMSKPVDNASISLSGAGIKAHAATNSTGYAVISIHPSAKGQIKVIATKVAYSNGTGMVIVK